MKAIHSLLAAATLAALASPARAEIALDVIGTSEIGLEGLFQADGNWFDDDVADLNGTGINGEETEFELRRAEVILKGKGIRWDWTAGYDAKADKFLDANARFKMGTAFLQGGQYKQPNSLEELTSTRHNDFISKSMTTNLFAVARRVGVAYGIENPDWGFTASAFGRELTRNLAKGNGYGARAYWAPINEVTGGNTFHLGVSLLDYDTDGDAQRLRVRPDADLSVVRLIDTGALNNTDHQTTFGAEAMWFRGPFRVQAEYMQSDIARYETPLQNGDDFTGNSWYVYGLWNITGETWTYRAGVPVTGYPNDPGRGMWQLAVRYDAADLNDAGVRGGDEQNVTLGVNWYWRANFKLMANYVAVDSSRFSNSQGREVDDNPNIFELRAQFHW